jgi:50S ribosomal subunit-associated GTPase HflX
VCDATGDYEMQLDTTLQTLSSLGFNKPYLQVLNKCDKAEHFEKFNKNYVCISAKENTGIEQLKQAILQKFEDSFLSVSLLVPYEKLGEFSALSKYLSEKTRQYTDGGLVVEGTIKKQYRNLFDSYLKK